MKKLLFIMILTFVATLSYSQRFYGGVLGGFNASQVEGDFASGYNKLGAVLGAWTQTDLANNFYWSMELKFNQKGSRIMPTKKNDYWKYIYRLNYADLPVMIGYQYSPSVSAFGGLSFGYLISKSGYNNYGEDPIVAYQNVAPWEAGLLVGAKINFFQMIREEWAKRLTLDMRIQWSAISVRTPHRFFIGSFHYGQFNNVISTTLYYRIERQK